MKTHIILGLILSLFLSNSALAALYLEPTGGYSFGKIGTGQTMMGTSYGGRLGVSKLGFHMGVDYLASNMSVNDSTKDADGEKMSDGDLKMTESGGFVGFAFPMFLRVYATYIFSAQAEINKIGYEFKDGKGMKYGISFTSIPFVNINFEYRNGKFGKVEDSDTGATANKKIGEDYEAYMVSLSIPISI